MSTVRDLRAALVVGDLALESIVSFRWESRANRPAIATVVVRAPLDTAFDALLGAPAELLFGDGATDARHAGIVVEITAHETEVDRDFGLTLEISIASAMWLLGESHDSRVFLDEDVQAIVTDVCAAHGIAADRLDFRLSETHDARPMTNQYAESAMMFVSRLCEAEGVVWFSEATDDGEKIVFTDRTSAADSVPGDGLRVVTGEGMGEALEVVTELRLRARTVTGKVSLRDYDFIRPTLDVAGDATAHDDTDLELYDFAENVSEPDAAKARAKIRLEAAQASKRTLEIEGRSIALAAGRIVKLAGAPGSLDGEYWVVALEQRFDGNAALATRASLLPKDVPYRAPLATPRPSVSGLETATVVVPKGSDVETIHTDEHARVKVKLPWDRSERVDDDASHWARVVELQTHDSLILPRIGWEVIVDYVEGDPDRPLVLGRVYNGVSMPPYALPEGKTRSVLQSASSPGGGGRNEIRMEDAAGSEEISITAEKDHTVDIAGDKTVSVVSHQKRDVGSNSSTDVGSDQELQITSGYENGAASRLMAVSGSREFTVAAVLGWTSGGGAVTTIGGSQTEKIGDPLKGLLDLAGQVAVEAVENEAKEAMSNLEGVVGSKVDQIMGPIHSLQGKLGEASDALGGDVTSMGSGLGKLASLPSPGDFAKGMLGKGTSAIDQAVAGAIDSNGRKALEAMGLDPGDDAGSSEANKPGVDGAAGGNSASQSACGPGHSITKVAASAVETVGGTKLVAAAGKVVTNVTAARSTTIGALQVDAAAGSRVETCSASKKETSVGLVSVVGGDEIEEVGGARTIKVGGAILEKISGNAVVQAGGAIAMAGAYWDIDASGSIVLSCGASTVTIGGGGIEISSPAITITGSQVQMPATVGED